MSNFDGEKEEGLPLNIDFNPDLPSLYENHATNCLNAKTARFLNDDSKEEKVTINGYTFIIHLNQPMIKKYKEVKLERTRDPLLPPYPAHKLCQHFDSHYIFINKSMICKGHVVISAASTSSRQTDMLDEKDCKIIAYILNSYNGDGIVYYNCGIKSGCSQIHKHLQFVPLKEKPILELMVKGQKLPFLYYYKNIDSYKASIIYEAYMDLMKNIQDHDYNFICSSNSIILVPRRNAISENEVVINSLGFCGHIMVQSFNISYARENPMEILTQVGFPSE